MPETTLVEVICEDSRWNATGLSVWAERAAKAVLRKHNLPAACYEIALLACDDTRIAALNADFRGKPMPTNVLSWPAWDLSSEADGGMPELPLEGTPDDPDSLGDIALAYDTCAREAQAQAKSFEAHVTHLVVHSVLHLLGYDHIRDKDAALMEETEIEILAQLGVENPYANGAELPQ